jgi:hypothetical protein
LITGPLDVVVVDPRTTDPVAKYMLGREPFYSREEGP